MSSFKKNRSPLHISKEGDMIINKIENQSNSKQSSKTIKEITIPFTEEMCELLEKIFTYFDRDISRRKLCSKYLLKILQSEAKKLGLE
jgi:hypothetical protein